MGGMFDSIITNLLGVFRRTPRHDLIRSSGILLPNVSQLCNNAEHTHASNNFNFTGIGANLLDLKKL